MLIRPTEHADREAVLELVSAAFGGREYEVQVVRDVWASPHHVPALDLVAVDDSLVVGHALHHHATVDDRKVLALGPLAVAPDRQRQGIGAELMAAAIAIADESGYPLIALLGHPSYYPQFGFEPAIPLGLHVMDPSQLLDPDAFMVRRLSRYEPSYRGVFRFFWEVPQ